VVQHEARRVGPAGRRGARVHQHCRRRHPSAARGGRRPERQLSARRRHDRRADSCWFSTCGKSSRRCPARSHERAVEDMSARRRTMAVSNGNGHGGHARRPGLLRDEAVQITGRYRASSR
jgi:hypothetical protein